MNKKSEKKPVHITPVPLGLTASGCQKYIFKCVSFLTCIGGNAEHGFLA